MLENYNLVLSLCSLGLDSQANNLALLSRDYRQEAHALNLQSAYTKYLIIIVVVLILLCFLYFRFLW